MPINKWFSWVEWEKSSSEISSLEWNSEEVVQQISLLLAQWWSSKAALFLKEKGFSQDEILSQKWYLTNCDIWTIEVLFQHIDYAQIQNKEDILQLLTFFAQWNNKDSTVKMQAINHLFIKKWKVLADTITISVEDFYEAYWSDIQDVDISILEFFLEKESLQASDIVSLKTIEKNFSIEVLSLLDEFDYLDIELLKNIVTPSTEVWFLKVHLWMLKISKIDIEGDLSEFIPVAIKTPPSSSIQDIFKQSKTLSEFNSSISTLIPFLEACKDLEYWDDFLNKYMKDIIKWNIDIYIFKLLEKSWNITDKNMSELSKIFKYGDPETIKALMRNNLFTLTTFKWKEKLLWPVDNITNFKKNLKILSKHEVDLGVKFNKESISLFTDLIKRGLFNVWEEYVSKIEDLQPAHISKYINIAKTSSPELLQEAVEFWNKKTKSLYKLNKYLVDTEKSELRMLMRKKKIHKIYQWEMKAKLVKGTIFWWLAYKLGSSSIMPPLAFLYFWWWSFFKKLVTYKQNTDKNLQELLLAEKYFQRLQELKSLQSYWKIDLKELNTIYISLTAYSKKILKNIWTNKKEVKIIFSCLRAASTASIATRSTYNFQYVTDKKILEMLYKRLSEVTDFSVHEIHSAWFKYETFLRWKSQISEKLGKEERTQSHNQSRMDRSNVFSIWKYYEILWIWKDSNQKEVNSSYRKLSKKYHPDNQETWNPEMMRKINNAKDKIFQYNNWK